MSRLKFTLLSELATATVAHNNALNRGNINWAEKHKDKIKWLCKNYLPTGSGFDAGPFKVEYENCTDKKLVLFSEFHIMDSNGYYDGWTEVTVTVESTFLGPDINVKLSREDVPELEEYIAEFLHYNLNQEVLEYDYSSN